jgi:tRNA nucleotidyltransferase (CCA-adding enzyme)
VLDVLESAGHEAWAVGGWVRDSLLGRPSHDVDVTTSARWPDAKAALEAAGIDVHETGTAHGTITAVVDGEPVEVTTYRVEGTYTDMRHPDSVTFVSSVTDDLARRDFTINAMAWHPTRGLLDPFGGRDDLVSGVIRAVGDPATRFSEDALRVLRAVRFACRMGFVVEEATQSALTAAAPELAHVARERVGSEMGGILGSGRAGWALMNELEVMSAAIPSLGHLAGFEQNSPYHCYDVLVHTVHVMDSMEAITQGEAPARLRWASMLHDIAKPRCYTVGPNGQGHFFGHPAEGARMTDSIMRDLAIPLAITRPAVVEVRLHDRPVKASRQSVCKFLADLDRRLQDADEDLTGKVAHEILVLKRADALAKAQPYRGYAFEVEEVERVLDQVLSEGACFRVRDLAVSGADVMAACDMRPGREVGETLSRVLDAVMEGRVPNDRDAITVALADGTIASS